MADQALVALFNLMVSVVAARILPPTSFGVFAIILASYTLVLGVFRSLVVDPYFFDSPAHGMGFVLTDVNRQVAAAALALGVIAGTMLAVCGIGLGGSAGAALVVLAFSTPALLVLDVGRYIAFRSNNAILAVALDSAWVLGSSVLFCVASILNVPRNLWFVTSIWCLGAIVPAICVLVFFRVAWPTVRWVTSNWVTSKNYVVEFFASSITSISVAFVVGLLSSPQSAGSVRGAQTLLGPMNLLYQVQTVYLARRGRDRLDRGHSLGGLEFFRLSFALAVLAVVSGLLIAVVPDEIGTSILGDTWAGAQSVVIPLSISMGMNSIMTGAGIALKFSARSYLSRNIRIAYSTVVLFMLVVATLRWDVVGAVIIMAVCSSLGAAIYCIITHRVLRVTVIDIEALTASNGEDGR